MDCEGCKRRRAAIRAAAIKLRDRALNEPQRQHRKQRAPVRGVLRSSDNGQERRDNGQGKDAEE